LKNNFQKIWIISASAHKNNANLFVLTTKHYVDCLHAGTESELFQSGCNDQKSVDTQKQYGYELHQ